MNKESFFAEHERRERRGFLPFRFCVEDEPDAWTPGNAAAQLAFPHDRSHMDSPESSR